MKKAVAYVRVSTESQATEGISLEAQKLRIENWCLANGYVLESVHTDAGVSGKTATGRPGLAAAVAATCIRRGNALVVYSLSRLARSTKDMLSISDRLERAGADLVSLTERIDTTSAAGRMVFRMLAVLAEFERDLVSERTRSSMAVKKARGEVVGEVPLGYRREGRSLVADSRTQRSLALVRRLGRRGMSVRAIASELTKRRLPTAKGGHVWHPTTVQRILRRVAA